jgi:hypothetical protein
MAEEVFWKGAFGLSGDVTSSEKAIIENWLQNYNERSGRGVTYSPGFWLDVVKEVKILNTSGHRSED